MVSLSGACLSSTIGYYNYKNFCSIWKPRKEFVSKYFGMNGYLPMTIEMAGYLVTVESSMKGNSRSLNRHYEDDMEYYLNDFDFVTETKIKEPSVLMDSLSIPQNLRGLPLCQHLFEKYGLSGIFKMKMSGRKFNQITHNAPMYKVLDKDDQFVVGRNVDPVPIDFEGDFKLSGGIYFSDSKNINCKNWLKECDCFKTIREVEIPDDAMVYVEKETAAKTSIIILGNDVTKILKK